jgi:hypothetical protein
MLSYDKQLKGCMINKISPDPSLPKRGKKWKSLLKRGREKGEMTQSIT